MERRFQSRLHTRLDPKWICNLAIPTEKRKSYGCNLCLYCPYYNCIRRHDIQQSDSQPDDTYKGGLYMTLNINDFEHDWHSA